MDISDTARATNKWMNPLQTGAASHCQDFFLTGNFNHPDSCWRDNTAGHKQPRRFLKCMNDNILTEVTAKPGRRDALLDLLLASDEGL